MSGFRLRNAASPHERYGTPSTERRFSDLVKFQVAFVAPAARELGLRWAGQLVVVRARVGWPKSGTCPLQPVIASPRHPKRTSKAIYKARSIILCCGEGAGRVMWRGSRSGWARGFVAQARALLSTPSARVTTCIARARADRAWPTVQPSNSLSSGCCFSSPCLVILVT